MQATKVGSPSVVLERSASRRSVVEALSSPKIKSETTENKLHKLHDKRFFTLGVFNALFSAFLTGGYPYVMPYFYSVKFVVLITYRLYDYSKIKAQLYLLDFCYYANVLLIVYLFAFPDNAYMFQVVFGAVNGPLLWAISLFRNSLVFHSVDKVTSALIHITPCIVTWCLRWRIGVGGNKVQHITLEGHGDHWITWHVCFNSSSNSVPQGSLVTPDGCAWQPAIMVGGSFLFYCAWMFVYGILMICILRHIMPLHQYGTAFHFLTNNEDGKFRKYMPQNDVLKVMAYVAINLMFALFTMAWTLLLYTYFAAHCLFLAFFLTHCVYNGASWYVEVFAKGKTYRSQSDAAEPNHDRLVGSTPSNVGVSGVPSNERDV